MRRIVSVFFILLPSIALCMQPQSIEDQEKLVRKILEIAEIKSLEMQTKKELETGLERVQKCFDLQALLKAYGIEPNEPHED